ncbi:DHH family phosphoesterase [Rhodococcoides fascians]|uniref:DHH family phosphoesterase n=1 Tax=Rhodococcoides fascians TaxID=1828 RepID=UPI00068C99F4|nr:DHH family phosphoesterase [Rhodococcus fascians]
MTTPAEHVLDSVISVARNFSKRRPFDIIRERRGWDTAAIEQIELGTDEPLPDLERSVALIHAAITQGRTITVLTDYDMDGVAAGILTYAGLAELGAQVELVVPHYEGPREITAEKVDQAVAQYPTTSLIITCDVGINSNDGIDRAHQRGIEVIVTDHHIQTVDACRADAVVDPNRTGCTYPEPDICGSQVALHILDAYARAHYPTKSPAIAMLSVFGGIGGLADVMPLRGQTRALVRRALGLLVLALPEVPVYTKQDSLREDNPIKRYKIGEWNLEEPDRIDPDTSTLMRIVNGQDHDRRYSQALRGLSLLLARLIAAGKVSSVDSLDVSFLGFTLTPMFNATRRVDADMADSFMVFVPEAVRASRPDYMPHVFASDSEIEKARRIAADTLLLNNENRKELTKAAMEDIHLAEQPYAPYLWFSEAKPGVLGLLASNLLTETGMPTMVVNPHTLSGSARAPEWFDVLGFVADMNDSRLHALGHHQACGVGATELEAFEGLISTIDGYVRSLPEPDPADLRADLHMMDIESLARLDVASADTLLRLQPDIPVPMATELVDLAKCLSELAPFGQGFPAADIRVTFQPVNAAVKLMSRKEEAGELEKGVEPDPADYKHVKITTGHGLDLLWWNKADQYQTLMDAALVTATITLSTNQFMGNIRPQAIVSSLEIHSGQSLQNS